MTADDLTPAQRKEVQGWIVKRYEQRRWPAGTKRRWDHAVAVKRYDMDGELVSIDSVLVGKPPRWPEPWISTRNPRPRRRKNERA